MALVNLSELSQDQRYGIQFGVQRANAGLQSRIDAALARNAHIASSNSQKLPEFHEPLLDVPALMTEQSFADSLVLERVAALQRELYDEKKRLVEAKFNELTTEQQEAFLASLGVPPVLNG